MDSDNPWGGGSSDPSPNLDSTSTPPGQTEEAPRLSLDVQDEEEQASWGTDAPATEKEVRDVEENKELQADQPAQDQEKQDRVDAQDEQRTSQEVTKGESELEESTSPVVPDSTPTSDDIPPLAPPIPIVETEPPASAEPPMDEFPDDDAFSSTSASPPSKTTATFAVPAPAPLSSTESAEAPPMDDFDDFDDDEFGEMGEANENGGGDDDFGDFGDFGDSAPLDEAAFDAPPPDLARTTSFSTEAVSQPPPPVPSTSFLPPLRLDLSNRPTRRSVAPQLRDFVTNAWGDVSDKVSDEPERQVEGVAQVLVSEESRNLLASLSSLPALRPLDWRRSKIRREHLISMGIPVNLDDSNESKPISALSISSSPRLSGPHPRSTSAPPGASPLPFSSSRVPSRSSTPFADRERTRRSASPPPLDKTLADQLLAFKEDDLTLMSLDKLKGITDELEKISVEASEVLTHALLMREKESQDKETYNGMISDLVSAAAKMKTTSAVGGGAKGRDPKRQGSIRWGRGGG